MKNPYSRWQLKWTVIDRLPWVGKHHQNVWDICCCHNTSTIVIRICFRITNHEIVAPQESTHRLLSAVFIGKEKGTFKLWHIYILYYWSRVNRVARPECSIRTSSLLWYRENAYHRHDYKFESHRICRSDRIGHSGDRHYRELNNIMLSFHK